MDLFKKSLIVFVFLCVPHLYAALSTFEKQKALMLQAHLRNVALRSKYKPLSSIARKSIDASLTQLQALEKKDPESHVFENAQKLAKTINYDLSSQSEKQKGEISQSETFKEKPQSELEKNEQSHKAIEKINLERQDKAFTEFQNHLALLQKQETWLNAQPKSNWQEKALVMLQKPELINIVSEDGLNIPSVLVDAIVNRYNYFIVQAYKKDEKSQAEQLQGIRNAFRLDFNKAIIGIYLHQLQTPGVFWDKQTSTIDTLWLEDVLNFFCYIMSSDFSDDTLQSLQKILQSAVTKKYTTEKAETSEMLEKTKKHIDDFLKKCQLALQKKQQVSKEPLKQAENKFVAFMNIISASNSNEEMLKENEEQAFNLAKNWLDKVPFDQLVPVADKIKTLYKDALAKQVKLSWWQLLSKEKDTTPLQKVFNDKIDMLIASKIPTQPVPKNPVPAQAPAQSQQPTATGSSLEELLAQGQAVPQGPVQKPSASEPSTQTIESPLIPVPKQAASGQSITNTSGGLTESKKQEPTEKKKSIINEKLFEHIDNLEGPGYWFDESNVIGSEWIENLAKMYSDNNIIFNENELRDALQDKLQNMPEGIPSKELKEADRNREIDKVIKKVKEELVPKPLPEQPEQLGQEVKKEGTGSNQLVETKQAKDFIELMNEIKTMSRTPETEKSNEEKAIELAKMFLDSLDDDQLNAGAINIKNWYKEAVKEQSAQKGFQRALFSSKETESLEKSFNEKLNKIISDRGVSPVMTEAEKKEAAKKENQSTSQKVAAHIEELNKSGSWRLQNNKIFSKWDNGLSKIYTQEPTAFNEQELRDMLKKKLDSLPTGVPSKALNVQDKINLTDDIVKKVKVALKIQ